MIASIAELTALSIPFVEVLLGIYGLLILFTAVFLTWHRLKPSKGMREIVLRIYSWWAILALITVVFIIPHNLATVIVAFLTFMALRELLSHVAIFQEFRRSLFYVYLTIPVQFYLARYGSAYQFSAFIPVFMFFLISIRNILSGNYRRYLEFNGKVFWALMLIVYGFSQLTYLRRQEFNGDYQGGGELVILLVVFLTQFNDVLQFIWGKSVGRRKLSPKISPNKTVEGFLGAALTLGVIAYLLRGYLPFHTGLEAAAFGVVLSAFGLFGDLNISAIKRDIGIKDMDDLIPGHGGLMDRFDSLSFTFPFAVHYLIMRGYI